MQLTTERMQELSRVMNTVVSIIAHVMPPALTFFKESVAKITTKYLKKILPSITLLY